MEERFKLAIKTVLGIEGGLSTDPADRGGITNYGVSLRFLVKEGQIDLNRDGIADFDLDMDGDIDGADIKLLTPGHAASLARRCFWERARCGELPAPIDIAVFDQAFNGGITAAVKLLQRAVNRAGHQPPLLVDGVNGPKTIGATRALIARRKTGAIVEGLRAYAEQRYRQIVAADPTQARFLRGWVSRAKSLGRV